MKEKYLNIKDFADVPGKGIQETADYFQAWFDQMDEYQMNAFDITTSTATGREVVVTDHYGEDLITAKSFVSSNYLGLNTHPEVKKAASEAVEKYGMGTCTAPIIGGYIDNHKELEQKIARIHKKDDALIFSSGFAANIGIAQAILGKEDLAIVDKFIHASMFDGLANTNVKFFGHNNLEYLETNLQKAQGNYKTVAVIVDGVYSQDGDLPVLPEICKMAKKYGAIVIMDDAHAFGVLGENGYGAAEHFDVEEEVDIITGTLSKAVGTIGGYVTANKSIIRYLRYYSRSSIFSASLPPAMVAAASKAIDLFTAEPQLKDKLWENTKYIKSRLADCGYNIGESESPIVPIKIGDDKTAKLVARKLLEKGVYIIPAVYPAVRLRDSRLRLNVSATHTKADLDHFVDSLNEVNELLNFKK
ncbi:MAG: aminotransferase class I/II-fold pyridoxal phosphate-dependent enzyme [Marinifilaceae bacterium]|jgi:glycine C-acetyltransferase|nr:aminotransferase class I/II-fold pyridoxal phosphate-dependent enzyme [Marinifilaceae bacterium]